MIQRVDTVLIGKKYATGQVYEQTSESALVAEGSVMLFDENRKPISNAANANTIYVGVAGKAVQTVKKDGTIVYSRLVDFSNPIKKDSKPRMHVSAHENPTYAAVTFDFSAATIEAGHRYVLRIVYKDIEGAPGQFTHTYGHYAATAEVKDLIDALAKKINHHPNRRINVTKTATSITLTAMEKDDNEGVNSLNEYSSDSMDATLYQTLPGQLLSNIPEEVAGVAKSTVAGKPGVGYWKQVRDQEVRNMGYKGMVYTGAFPSLSQELKTVEGEEYEVITIENDNLYLSNDNQYIKTTPMVTEIYCPKAGGLKTALQSFPSMVTLEDAELTTDAA